jgi:hypothetical protein
MVIQSPFELGMKVLTIAFSIMHGQEADRLKIAEALRAIADEFDPATSSNPK